MTDAPSGVRLLFSPSKRENRASVVSTSLTDKSKHSLFYTGQKHFTQPETDVVFQLIKLLRENTGSECFFKSFFELFTEFALTKRSYDLIRDLRG